MSCLQACSSLKGNTLHVTGFKDYKTHAKTTLFKNQAKLKMKRSSYLWDPEIVLEVSNIQLLQKGSLSGKLTGLADRLALLLPFSQ